MLKSIYIRDYAIIDELEIEFEKGLNIVTGETGAGKSIIVNALKLALGARASADVIRTGGKKAVVEAVFCLPESESLDSAYAQGQIDKEENLILRREISSAQSRAFVNDTPVRINVLKLFTTELIDLHGQHEHQSLLSSENHIKVLDRLADLGSFVSAYRKAFSSFQTLQIQLESVRSAIEKQKQRSELNAFKLAEISSVEPIKGEDDLLYSQLTRLQNIDRLRGETEDIVGKLLENDASIVEVLAGSAHAIASLAELDGELGDHAKELDSIVVAIQEVASELRRYSDRIEPSPDELRRTEERLSQLENLKRKYGGTLDSALELWQQLQNEQQDESLLAHQEQELSSELATCSEELVRLAQDLSKKRRNVADGLTDQVVAQLASLGMQHAAFEVRFEPPTSGPVCVDAEESQLWLNDRGMDVVEFYISANKGVPLRPLSKTASGGEVSRIMLALKSILADRSSIPVLMFDEIDVGISGKVAQQVGASMHRLADSHQIIAITHLPQIAALGDAHYVVEKVASGDAVSTSIRQLTIEERAAQVAMLLGGGDKSDTAIEHARTLLASGTVEN